MKQLLSSYQKYKIPFFIFLLWLFHISGVIGISQGNTEWFLSLTPLNLLVGTACVLLCIPPKNKKAFIALLIPFFIGMIAEILGVNYGLIFGNYTYGENLGIKILGVPWMIGVNWMVLTYSTSTLSRKISSNDWLSAAIASSLMVLLDVIIEVSAPRFDFWEFKDGIVPLQNYIGWWGTAFIAHLLYQKMTKEGNSTLSIHLLATTLFFFGIFLFI